MRLSRRLPSLVVLAASAGSCMVTPIPPQPTTSGKNEPFRSFRLLDGKLTQLSSQHAALKQALINRGGSSHGTAPANELSATLVHMASATTSIEGITAKLERLYQNRREPFGARMFRVMHLRAQAVQSGINSVRRATTRSKKMIAEKRLDQQLVSLIIQYQAASGGYAAAHCVAKSRTCCQPKRSRDLQPGEQAACKWTCVIHAGTCKGFLGPRIP